MRVSLLNARLEAFSRNMAATFGTLPAVVLAAAALAKHLPVPEPKRFAFGFATVIPLWLVAMHIGFLARSARRLWLACAIATAALVAMLWA